MADAIGSGDADRARACALAHVRANRLVTLRVLFGPAEEPEGGSGAS